MTKKLSLEEAKKRHEECFVGRQILEGEYDFAGEAWPYKYRRATWGDQNAATAAAFSKKVEMTADGQRAGVNYDPGAYNKAILTRCIVEAPFTVSEQSFESLPGEIVNQLLKAILEASQASESTKKG